MSTNLIKDKTIYPESDGKPMAENTLQYEYIVIIKEGLDCFLTNSFVAADLFWYPVKGKPKINQAPDVMVALGRPKGHRGSYKEWEEDNIAPQVVFEILSPGNTVAEMTRKFNFYNTYGVEEYYIYDPQKNELTISQRIDGQLVEIDFVGGWVSPLLEIRFQLSSDRLQLFYPNGDAFLSYQQLKMIADRERLEKEEALAEKEAALAEKEMALAEKETALAKIAQEKSEKEIILAERERLKEKLRKLGIDPDND
ncbi:MAG: Uma2 family endonuclease [Acidobacteria bacterium]|nr:Uma2 family endonuclease [Acidobacteriota bacterium]